MKELKRFSDFAKEHVSLDGEKVKIDSILDVELEIIAFRINQSKFNSKGNNSCLTIQFIKEGKKYITFTGSGVLLDQAKMYSDELPFIARIRKIDRYYTLS